jgi:hypothetical protein
MGEQAMSNPVEANISDTDLLHSFDTTKESYDKQYSQILNEIANLTESIKNPETCMKTTLECDALIFRLRSLLINERFHLNKLLSSTDREGVARLLMGNAKARLQVITDLNIRLTELSTDAEHTQRAWWAWTYKN